MTPVIEVEHLKKYFTTPRGLLHAVDDVTFSIEKGKTMGELLEEYIIREAKKSAKE